MTDPRPPNPALLVTCGRIGLTVPFVASFHLPGPWDAWAAGGLFVLAGLSDALDGWLARKLDRVTDLGAVLDPVADKILQAAALVMLAADGRVPAAAAAILLARDFLVGGLRQAGRGRSVLPVTGVAKGKTAVLFAALGVLLFAPVLPEARWPTAVGSGLLWAGVALSLWSGSLYVLRAVRTLSAARP